MPTHEQLAAFKRAGDLVEKGRLEEALDALTEAGIVNVEVTATGEKTYAMPEHIARVIRGMK